MIEVACLRVTPKGQPEIEVELTEHLTIGRSADNHLVLDDTSASRRHAEIRRTPTGKYRLFDLGSVNGIWINGRRMTAPVDLNNGDLIEIGEVEIRLDGVDAPLGATTMTTSLETKVAMRKETVVVLVSDIRNYTGMSENLEQAEFSELVSDWFRQSGEIIEAHNGTIDKFIGDAVMAYWQVGHPDNPTEEVSSALISARETLALSRRFASKVEEKFPGYTFEIGIGINLGDAIMGNVGVASSRSFTIVGDSVNVAFRFETLSKQKGHPIIVGGEVVRHASKWFRFHDLGQVTVKGRKEPIAVHALQVDPKPRV